MACSKQNDACMKAAEEQRKAEQSVRQCNSLPNDRNQITRSVDSAWYRKKAVINDGLKTLHKLRSDLDSDYKWTIGDPGSMRELTTYLAQVTKTTTDLIEDLGGFSTSKSSRAANDVYEQIKLGRTSYEVVTQDAQKVVANVLLDAASDVSPIARSAKTVKDFSDNISDMMKTPEDMKKARDEVRRQLEIIDSQASTLQRNLDQIRREHEPSEVEPLLQTYQSVQKMCSASSPTVSRP
jgi:hypothetical protein